MIYKTTEKNEVSSNNTLKKNEKQPYSNTFSGRTKLACGP